MEPVNIAPPPVVKKFSSTNKKEKLLLVAVAVVVVAAGVGTGWLFSGARKTTSSNKAVGVKTSTKEAGVTDDVNKESAEGKLEAGGISGEGTHHLVRDGGPSQYVYLTSSVINLEDFVGKKVMVWGQTISARKAGWLMDVSRIKETE